MSKNSILNIISVPVKIFCDAAYCVHFLRKWVSSEVKTFLITPSFLKLVF